MAATKKSAAKKSTTKKATARRSTTKAAKTTKATERKAWIGASRDDLRLGQQVSISWRVAGKPGEFVSLWQEGPDGTFHYTVPPKSARLVQPLTAGKYVWSIRAAVSGEELVRVERIVRT